MKKTMLLTLLVPFLCACSNDEETLLRETTSETVDVKILDEMRTPAEAIEIAKKAYSNFFETKNRAEISVADNVIAIPSRTYGVARSGNDTALYVVNFENDKGFAIVDAYKNNNGLIGISDEGNYDAVNQKSNAPGLNIYIDRLQAEIEESHQLRANITPVEPEPFERLVEMVDTLSIDGVNPRAKARWGEDSFYGKYCPNNLAGCGPVALATLLSIYKEPTRIGLRFPDAPINVTDIYWEALEKVHISMAEDVYKSEKNSIALILRELGERSISKYDESNTYSDFIKTYLVLYDLMNKVDRYFLRELNSKKWGIDRAWLRHGVALCNATPTNDPYDENGTYWVIDGYKYYQVRYRYIKISMNTPEVIQEDIFDYTYYHCNWIWHGKGNGYFRDILMNPSKSPMPDDNSQIDKDITYKFNYNYTIPHPR